MTSLSIRSAQVLRVGLGGLLIVAGSLKLRDPASFATEIANYQLWPSVAPMIAAIVPVTEVLLGSGLIAFPVTWRRAATLGTLGLFAMFFTAVAWAAFHRINIACGCFGGGGDTIGPLTVLRNLSLIAATVALQRLER